MPERDPPPTADSDADRLASLFETHRQRLRAMVQRRLDPRLAARICADDVLQEAFFLAQRKWLARGPGSAAGEFVWLYGIARDKLIEMCRREMREIRDVRRGIPLPEDSSVDLAERLIGSDTPPSSAAARSERRERIREALAQLKDTDREILWMKHYDELTFREAATVLGLKEDAATLRYFRALERLKRALVQDNIRSESDV
ncbi:MAG: sigma-70 family RNA polymerase sigma factor [Planctomycetes bacterium]|nr:sigma-70 family RNA polymerase sigma factor [Planctomycetota bacterium]